MAIGKEIRDQIKSVSSTQKITSAMEMVAASKMRRTQERMEHSRPYSEKIAQVAQHVSQSNSEYEHPYLHVRDLTKVGVIVVSSDRGLCGGLNINLFRELIKKLQDWEQNNIESCFAVIGSKAKLFLSRIGKKPVAEVNHVGDTPNLNDFIGPVKVMLDKYKEGSIDHLLVVYNEFVNSMVQKPTIKQLLPIEAKHKGKEFKIDASLKLDLSHHWDYIYEPDSKQVMDKLLGSYIESIVYQSVVENISCEQSARMVAMKSATDNAGELIDNLQLVYNKARQAAITSELADIVGGAAAIN